MKDEPIRVNSEWQMSDGRVFVVFEVKPFGRVYIIQKDRRSYGTEMTMKSLRHNFKKVKQ